MLVYLPGASRPTGETGQFAAVAELRGALYPVTPSVARRRAEPETRALFPRFSTKEYAMSNTPETADGQPADPRSQDAAQAKPHESSWVTALEEGIEEIRTQPAEVVFLDVLKIDLPYIVMLSMAVVGIGLVTLTGEPVGFYWEVLTIVYCGLCIFIGWRHADTREERVKLVWTQVAHWAAFLFAMWLIYTPTMRALIDVNATGLNLMVLLALGTFVAGVHAEAWQICVVGLILALFVPAMANVQRSSLFIMVALIGILFVVVSLSMTFQAHRRRAAAAEEETA